MELNLKKFDLDLKSAYDYFYDCLSGVNELSTKVIDIVNFNDGKFFTFLNENIGNQQSYEFKSWNVAKGVKKKTIGIGI